jgi:hypothetical protein
MAAREVEALTTAQHVPTRHRHRHRIAAGIFRRCHRSTRIVLEPFGCPDSLPPVQPRHPVRRWRAFHIVRKSSRRHSVGNHKTHKPSVRTSLNVGRPIEAAVKLPSVHHYWTNSERANESRPLDVGFAVQGGPVRVSAP